MKKVLLLGDSIRILYEPVVKAKLQGKANVFGPEENGRWAGYTLNSLRFWLPYLPNPDIVHVNNGLWDMGDDYGLGRPFSMPEEYASALSRMVIVLKKLCGDAVIIVLATTTPRADTDLTQTRRYNDILRTVAEESGCRVNDLFSAIAVNLSENIGADLIHLTEKGIEIAAAQVAGCLQQHL
jgi:lysophospholipase L1-like esterase